MESYKNLDYVRVSACYSRFYGKVGKIASVIKSDDSLAIAYNVWFADEKETIRFNHSEVDRV